VRTGAADEATPVAAISFPRDDGPHDALTEWWYYTGQIVSENGDAYGFEQVVFKAKRGAIAGFASHVAITDPHRPRFTYDQRAVFDDGTIARPGPGFDVAIGDWSMRGANGDDELRMNLAGYAYDLRLASDKPAVLHGGDGYIHSDPETGSYYYSRTRIAVTGTLTVDGVQSSVTGEAWMDHQWGNFTHFSRAGWDWFSVQLDDQTEIMIYQFRDTADVPSLGAATFVAENGTAVALAAADVRVAVTDQWRSPHSGATYPIAWTVRLPRQELTLTLVPAIEDQELDTRASTGVTYWEGLVGVVGTLGQRAIRGHGYVELTGYTRRRDGAVP
jgi:predicted secreted hydrolase